MKKEIQIRPEQARYVMGLKEKAQAAHDAYMAALNASIAGLATGRVQTIGSDGTITLEVEDEA